MSGEVKSDAYLDVQKIARDVINDIGYVKGEYMFDGNSCGVISAIHEQSPDINQGVDRSSPEEQGAGDQGMMFGYATNETENHMPLALDLSHKILIELSKLRKENKDITYLRHDDKSQSSIPIMMSLNALMLLSFPRSMTILIWKRPCLKRSKKIL